MFFLQWEKARNVRIVMPEEIHHENIKARRWRIPSYSNQSNSIKVSTNSPNIVQKYYRLRLPLVITSLHFHTVWNNILGFPLVLWIRLAPFGTKISSSSIQTKPGGLERGLPVTWILRLRRNSSFFFSNQTYMKVFIKMHPFTWL